MYPESVEELIAKRFYRQPKGENPNFTEQVEKI
jgi:hypothetical protein